MSLQGFKDQVGEDLWALIERVSAPLVTVTIVTSLPSVWCQRASFRLQFADGRVLKGRRCETSDQAERIEYLARFLNHQRFPKVLARCRSALLTEWIEGRPLTFADYKPDLLARCGELQGWIHRIPLPHAASPDHLSLSSRRTDLDRSIQLLVAGGVLAKQEGRRIFDLAMAHAPDTFAVGFIHGDFCAENIVLRPPEHISVIDNDTVLIDAYDYDLGRTWYRWPMNRTQIEVYYSGYRQYRSPDSFITHFPYWAVSALVDSAKFRLRSRAQGLSIPVRRLRAIVDGVQTEMCPDLRFPPQETRNG
ncbi:MAG: aminoglycoside phosphotransferase family protein [Candidatus Binatia bacterium]